MDKYLIVVLMLLSGCSDNPVVNYWVVELSFASNDGYIIQKEYVAEGKDDCHKRRIGWIQALDGMETNSFGYYDKVYVSCINKQTTDIEKIPTCRIFHKPKGISVTRCP